ncbi:MAG: hypothetical protein JKY50_01370 [Oleispira sp.]|nr:hypothetical protein [Oleispira sp.]MBL4881612.1 hypothetical protein [Oleispira sp.]
MNENKIKHLEFIQNVITRMNSNSFLIKGWGLTLVSALFALASASKNLDFVFITGIVLVVFWILDGFFISIERKYRDLYNHVRVKKDNEIDFSMKTSDHDNYKNSWRGGILSKTLIPYYGIAISTSIIVFSIIKCN